MARWATTAEHRRLAQDAAASPGWPSDAPWRRWGPYLAERAWGTVREDYSPNGDAWGYFSHDQARSKACRWGEDGLAGVCDRYQLLCFSLALWNGRDPILKERAFGLVPSEGNHGEDVKEYYFYLDNLPSHAYMRWLYKYPQAPFPYQPLVEENRRRDERAPEFELLDTGVFAQSRYFDVFVEYAKASPEDLVVRIEAFNRGPDPAEVHLVPQLWFRNTWAWGPEAGPEPSIRLDPADRPNGVCLVADDATALPPANLGFAYRLGPRRLYAEPGGEVLFTDNETNGPRVYGPGAESRSRYTKDAFHRKIVGGECDATNPANVGTKACLHDRRVVPAGGSTVLRLRLTDRPTAAPLDAVGEVVRLRKAEADEFYATIHPPRATAEERAVQRQAFAGLLWSKQLYLFDVGQWLDGDDPRWPPPTARAGIRNGRWRHLSSMRVLAVPDKWEYPWFAAWDLAFQTIPLALIDPELAKEQLWVLLFDQFLHPNGQLPSYEWEFSDLNPPVHAWAVWRVYNMDRIRAASRPGGTRRPPDRAFLERCFHKLLLNFTWWVNRVDSAGQNVFEGGFLGLDNIAAFDRSEPYPGGAVLEQSDATGWMGMYCLNLMRIALELAKENPVYEGLAVKFFEHYVYIGAAMTRMGAQGWELWDEVDGFFYDVLRHPDGRFDTFRVRSLVGLIPLYAVERLALPWIAPFHEFEADIDWFMEHRPDLVRRCISQVEHADHTVRVLTIVDLAQIRRVLTRVWDPAEFMSPHGLRSLSRAHREAPFVFEGRAVRYEPAEAETKIKGGNSNWRGPVWFPTAFLMIESLRKLGKAYGRDAEVLPGVTFRRIATELADRLIALFTRGPDGRRPIFPPSSPFQDDPFWRELVLFFEYFDGETGLGLGASHQTGWTALVASLIDEWRR
ncbi:MAG TPA: glucosidase [Chloroflexota bacterium]|nr:glucosidase [Chloroflexota bacterium]